MDAISSFAEECAEHFHVSFRGSGDEESRPYFLIQRQFEFPDDGRCLIEFRPPEDGGHFHVQSAKLSRDLFRVRFGSEGREAVIALKKDVTGDTDFCRILETIIPEVKFDR